MLGAETELTSALSNLLTNAVRYTPDGGTITVRWEREPDGGARYSVQDTGIGIPARHLPRLTERFYRVDRGRSRAVGGTGLGLAITKHIAMRHDAELLITSEPGKGSVFALRFPAERIAIDEPA
ncbi:Phosphate regulon sensor protein PhoR [compost metagenome]